MTSIKVLKPTQPVKNVYVGGTLQPPIYIPTFYEWIAQKGITVFAEGSLPVGSSPIYTVPKENIFFLTGLNLSVTHAAAAAASYTAYYDNTSQIIARLRLVVNPSSENLVKDFTIPLKFNEGQTIGLNNAAGSGVASLSIVGILVPKISIPII